ncbi:MAG: type III secretion protein U [Chlamydiales bacterium]|jgi:type III secretion protein U
MGEKTEKATPKKLADARKKGQVAKSQDFPSAFTFIVSISATMAYAPTLLQKFSDMITGIYTGIPKVVFQEVGVSILREAMETILICSLPILCITAFVGVLINFLSVGPVLTFEVFKPDIKKFDPIKNLKNKFKMKTLVELIKSLLKISIAGYLIYTVMWDAIGPIIGTVRLPITATIGVFADFLKEVLFKVGLFFFVVAVFDFSYQKYNFAKEMKMEKHEIKQEHKNSEGDPQIKGQRKQIAREIAYSAGPEERVSMAKAIVTNPVHLAIAIGYEENSDPAPHILAMGSGSDAQLIVREAEKHEIPILRNISLAHQLYDEGEILSYVPKETYEAIAEILKWIASLEEAEPGDELELYNTETEYDV